MGFGRRGVRSEHFMLLSNNTQLPFPNTALCWVFLFVVSPSTHSIPARLLLLLPLMSCFLPIGAVLDWATLLTIQCTKGAEGAWVWRHVKLLCLPKAIVAATSVLPSFSGDWPACFVLRAPLLSFPLVLHPLTSSCMYVLAPGYCYQQGNALLMKWQSVTAEQTEEGIWG